jgi:phosphoenolpyruvate carboxylase
VREVDRALGVATGRTLPLEAAPVRFGSWMGGDRDGNPNVTPDVTKEACLLNRWVAAELYLKEVIALREELSMTSASDALRERVGNAREPYRVLLRGLRDRLVATVNGSRAHSLVIAACRRRPAPASMRNPSPSRCGCVTNHSSRAATRSLRRAGSPTS